MAHDHQSDYVGTVSALGPQKISAKTRNIYLAMMLVGFATFAYFAFGSDTPRVGWISFLHNLYIFTGLAAAGVVVATILQTASANWARPIKRIAESTQAFFPVAIVGFIILYFGAAEIYPWVTVPPAEHSNKHLWLTQNFVFARVIGGVIILMLVARWFSKNADRPDFGLAHQHNSAWPQPAGWTDLESEVAKAQKAMSLAGPIYCVLFAVIISFLAYDLIMSMDYGWFSTMFGGWNFTTHILMTWGMLYFFSHFAAKRFGIGEFFPKPMWHDLGKLTFGFTVVWGYLFFAQYLVIWYGNLPHEAGFLITRFHEEPWAPISKVILAMVFVLPFLLGLSRKRKMSFKTFAPVVIISFCGIWMERWMLITPAAWYFDAETGHYAHGLMTLVIADVLVFVGFLGLFLLVYTNYLFKRPVMPISDPRLPLGIHRH
ncbi:MAG: hypothetical protein H6510_08815 [Acidobacteria bacterium]|nr:hypothetical protein [Acidobacteriota bacterium]MCB9397904.1 hypothetical protein [Acidobacteriota bacterium]